jgi:uncharacterized protein YjgD (DUF1641 family)
MARPISLQFPPRDARAELTSRLQAAPVDHAEALLSAYEVLQGLHDRGVLDLLRGALGSADKVLEIGVYAADSPSSIRGIRNLLLLVQMLENVDPQTLGALTRAVPEALQTIRQQPEPPGLWQLLKDFLWNGNFRRGLSAFNMLLEAIGSNLARTSRKT